LFDGKCIYELKLPEPITKVLLDPLETTLLAGGLSGKIYVASMEERRSTSTFGQAMTTTDNYEIFDADKVPPANHQKPFHILQGQMSQVITMCFSMDATHLISSDSLGTIHIWHLGTLVRIGQYSPPTTQQPIQPIVSLQCTIASPYMLSHQHATSITEPPPFHPLKKQPATTDEKSICHKPAASATIPTDTSTNEEYVKTLQEEHAVLRSAYTKLQQQFIDTVVNATLDIPDVSLPH